VSTDHATPARPPQSDDAPLAVVLTCCTSDTTYEPTAEAIARGRFACPDTDCGGWTFTSALTVSPAPGGAR